MRQGYLVTPWRWVSQEWDGWYIEKQPKSEKTWIEIYRNKYFDTFTQVGIESDANNELVMILASQKYNYTVKLSEGTYCNWTRDDSCSNQIQSFGYWAKKKG